MVPRPPIRPLRTMTSPGRALAAEKVEAAGDGADAGGVDEDAVAFATFDDFGIAGDDLDAGVSAAWPMDSVMRRRSSSGRPSSEDEGDAQIEGHGAAHREIVDGAVDGEEPMSPPGKKRV
jgi:hypothetical protein